MIGMERKFKVGDKVKARNNWDVRIICDDRDGPTPIVGLMTGDSVESVICYSADGHYAGGISDHPYDIIPAPKTRTVWVTWWPWPKPESGCAEVTAVLPEDLHYYTSAKARRDGALARIRVEIPEGRFDE